MKSNGDMLGALQSSMINTAPERGWGNCWIGNSIAVEMELEIKATFIEYDARFGRDKTKIETIEEGNKVTQKALLALLEHSIDGNNTDGLKKAKESLSQYLIDR